MASACVNDVTFPPTSPYPGCSPRISFSTNTSLNGSDPNLTTTDPIPSTDPFNFVDFEFRLNDSVNMLPADELFSNGKLVPLQMADPEPTVDEARKPAKKNEVVGSGLESFAVSPKAPTCTSRWREMLRLKRLQQQATSKTNSDPIMKKANLKSIKRILNRKHADSNLSLPLLKDSEPESKTKPEKLETEQPKSRNTPKVRVAARARRSADRCNVSADSPRMNASGKVVFQGLGRSSSSPSTFNGGTRVKHRGVERSLSANVRVTNVPVCKIGGGASRGLGLLFLRNSNNKTKY